MVRATRRGAVTTEAAARAGASAAERITRRIAELGDWRGATLARMRALVLEAAPGILEEVKWVKPSNPHGVAVWSRGGILCTGEIYQRVVKLTFARGAALKDPARLFNASLEGNARRAIDLREGEAVDAAAFQALVRAAIALNTGAEVAKGPARSAKTPAKKPAAATPKLLSGGNPQIAKGDGDAPVEAYLAAMPGWKQAIGRQLDALVVRTVPRVTKAVKWNSPFYGVAGKGWFLSFHCFTRYVKVTFFKGTSLEPVPPGTSKHPEVRYLDLHEGEPLDEARLARWIRQAAKLPGWSP